MSRRASSTSRASGPRPRGPAARRHHLAAATNPASASSSASAPRSLGAVPLARALGGQGERLAADQALEDPDHHPQRAQPQRGAAVDRRHARLEDDRAGRRRRARPSWRTARARCPAPTRRGSPPGRRGAGSRAGASRSARRGPRSTSARPRPGRRTGTRRAARRRSGRSRCPGSASARAARATASRTCRPRWRPPTGVGRRRRAPAVARAHSEAGHPGVERLAIPAAHGTPRAVPGHRPPASALRARRSGRRTAHVTDDDAGSSGRAARPRRPRPPWR